VRYIGEFSVHFRTRNVHICRTLSADLGQGVPRWGFFGESGIREDVCVIAAVCCSVLPLCCSVLQCEKLNHVGASSGKVE